MASVRGAGGGAKSSRGASAKGKGATAGRSAASQTAGGRSTAASDLVGLLVAVLAIAMGVSLAMPTSAPVTSLVATMLVMCFGAGAFLCPVALFIFAVSFFVGGDRPLSGRIALGMALIVGAVLSLMSINYAGAASDARVVLEPSVVSSCGGYVGGGVAFALLTLVGQAVGNVLLVGTMVAGAVVCGLSISGIVRRVGTGARDIAATVDRVREQHSAARPVTGAARGSLATANAGAYPQAGFDPAAGGEPSTSFLGARKTTVLTRDRRRAPASEASDGARELQPTQRRVAPTSRRRHPDIDVESSRRATEAPFDDQDVPEFLRSSAGSASAQKATPKGTVRKVRRQGGRPARTQSARQAQGGSASAHASSAGGARTAAHDTASRQAKKKPAAGSATVAATGLKAQQLSGARRPGEGQEEGYELPPFSMLSANPKSAHASSTEAELRETMERLQGTLAEFGLTSRVVDYVSGPLVTTFQIEMGEGERVNKIVNLEDDIALALAAESVRIFAPIPGTSRVGTEIPNKKRENVHLGDVLPHAAGGPLELALGRDAEGKPICADLAAMPHMLIAGATGSGKSVMINTIIMSILMRSTPKQVRLIMIDPKRVELGGYNGLPHLYVPVVTEPKQAASALQWAVSEMERRLKVFERAGARNISVYNKMCTSGKLSEQEHPPEPMPYMVLIIDELSDLMMVAGKDVEASIVRIAQLARAAGIHLIVATQRPSADVVTGLIKSNIETRIAFSVASGMDSRVILDQTGAERLLGRGDMLFKSRGKRTQRVLGCYVSDPEIESVVDFIREQGEPDYHEEILTAMAPGQSGGGSSGGDDDDPLVWEAAQIVAESQLGSTSGLQRRLKVGYARAGRIMDMLEAKGVVGPPDGSKPREVLLDVEGLEELRTQDKKYEGV